MAFMPSSDTLRADGSGRPRTRAERRWRRITRGIDSGATTKVDDARIDRAAGHAVELGRVGILHDDRAAGFVDRPDAARSVAARAGQKNPTAIARPGILGQRTEEHVDGQAQRPGGIFVGQQQLAARDDHLLLRRNQIDGVRLHLIPVADPMDAQSWCAATAARPSGS